METKSVTFFLALAVSLIIPEIQSSKILIMAPMVTRSEFNFYLPIVNALAGRNHQVTLVISTSSDNVLLNVTKIIPFDSNEIYGEFNNPFKMVEQGMDLSFLFLDMDIYSPFCVKTYENPEFQEKVVNDNFDLIILPSFVHQCFYGLAVKSKNVPIVLTATFPSPNYVVRPLGTYFPTSFLPYPTLPYSTKMNLWERTYNLFADLALQILSEWSYIPELEAIYQKYLGNKVGIKEISKNHVALVLSNTFHGVTYHRPLLPDNIEVGGLHCRPARPLPEDMETFVSKMNAPEGFIYFSFGSIIKGKSMPKELMGMFVRVLGKLNQRVLWKWEGPNEDFPGGLPENVFVSKWFPQQDILGHPNLRFFISHSGLFSIFEAHCHGAPLITFPVYFDQFTNSMQAVMQGYAIELDIYNLKEADLAAAVKELLSNPTYKERAVTSAKIFHDQPDAPLARAVYWIEYVLRHNGAPHLRSAARKLNWFQLHSLDVILILVLALISAIVILLFGLRFCLRIIFSKTANQQKIQKKLK